MLPLAADIALAPAAPPLRPPSSRLNSASINQGTSGLAAAGYVILRRPGTRIDRRNLHAGYLKPPPPPSQQQHGAAHCLPPSGCPWPELVTVRTRHGSMNNMEVVVLLAGHSAAAPLFGRLPAHDQVARPAARLQACRKAAQCSSLAPTSFVAATAMFQTWCQGTAAGSGGLAVMRGACVAWPDLSAAYCCLLHQPLRRHLRATRDNQ